MFCSVSIPNTHHQVNSKKLPHQSNVLNPFIHSQQQYSKCAGHGRFLLLLLQLLQPSVTVTFIILSPSYPLSFSLFFLSLSTYNKHRRTKRGGVITVMGCVQTKTLEGPEHHTGLERLKLENGYVQSNSDFVLHRRSTGQRHEPREGGGARLHHQHHQRRRQQQQQSRKLLRDRDEHDDFVGIGERKDLSAGAGSDRGKMGDGRREGKIREEDDDDLNDAKINMLQKKDFEEENEMVDGWPRWLVDNVPGEVLAGLVPRSAESYKMIDKVGQGTYSNVYKALDRETREIVALKKVRFNTSAPESIKFMAREIMILQRLNHPNVLKLKGLATSRMQYSLYLVFDFMQTDLSRIISRSEERLTEPQVKCYMIQLLSGLQHCHDRGILHRDIKGSNILVDKNGMLKIADFGLANYYSPNQEHPLTSRVVTLWYRAPELLLGATDYGVGIDLWSAGCLLAEMFTGIPVMPGRTEVEQLHRIFRLCGTPSEEYWRKFKVSTAFRPPKSYRPSFLETFRDLPPSSLGLLCTLLALDPAFRGSASKALKNQFFFTSPLACDLSGLPQIHREDYELDQDDEKIKYMNSKIRRSRTYLERRKSLAPKRQIEHAVSNKEELRSNAEPEIYVPSEEPGSATTSSASSSVNRAGAKDHSPSFSSPLLLRDQKTAPKRHHYANGGEKTKNLTPPVSMSRPSATKKDDNNRYRKCHAFRSSSTREFRNFKREEDLLFEIDN